MDFDGLDAILDGLDKPATAENDICKQTGRLYQVLNHCMMYADDPVTAALEIAAVINKIHPAFLEKAFAHLHEHDPSTKYLVDNRELLVAFIMDGKKDSNGKSES